MNPKWKCLDCEENKQCVAVEAAIDSATGECVEIQHCICLKCDYEWVE